MSSLKSGLFKYLLVALLLVGSASHALAVHLPNYDSWNQDFTVTIVDALSGLELSARYRLTTDPHPQATLRARTISEPTQQVEVPLSQVEAMFFHDQVRTAIRAFDLLGSAPDIDRPTKSLTLRIEAAAATLEMAYIPQDRPRSEAAAVCYFWMLGKLPAIWQKKAGWRSQFDAWAPAPFAHPLH